MAIAAPARPPSSLKIALLFAGLYAGQGVVGSLVQSALPVVLRDQGVGLDKIGWLGALFLPWVLKFLWAPVLDRYSWPRFGHRRSWILACQSLVILMLVIAAFVPPAVNFTLLAVVLVLAIIAAATQDTATDALAVETLPVDRRSFGGAAQVAGGYLGFVLGIGLWLPIYVQAGWTIATLVAAGCILIGSIPIWTAGSFEAAPVAPEKRKDLGLIAALKSPLVQRGMLFVLIYQLGSRLGLAMLGPFFVDAGMALDTIGYVKGTAGPLIGFGGALLSGFLLARFETKTALKAAALLHACIYAALAVIAFLDIRNLTLIAVLGAMEAFTFSLIFVALYTAMMGWCSPQRAGTDFSLLQSADALLAVVASIIAGQIGHHFGHGVNFTLAAGILVLAVLLAMRLLPPQSPAE